MKKLRNYKIKGTHKHIKSKNDNNYISNFHDMLDYLRIINIENVSSLTEEEAFNELKEGFKVNLGDYDVELINK